MLPEVPGASDLGFVKITRNLGTRMSSFEVPAYRCGLAVSSIKPPQWVPGFRDGLCFTWSGGTRNLAGTWPEPGT